MSADVALDDVAAVVATGVAIIVVAFELVALAWLRYRYFEVSFTRALISVTLGGVTFGVPAHVVEIVVHGTTIAVNTLSSSLSCGRSRRSSPLSSRPRWGRTSAASAASCTSGCSIAPLARSMPPSLHRSTAERRPRSSRVLRRR